MMRDEVYCIPMWSGAMANLYWQLRYCRRYDLAKRRRYYRYIAVERLRLEAEGHDKEHVRLLARYLSNPKNKLAQERCRSFEETGKILTNIQAKAKLYKRAMAEYSDFAWTNV